MRKLFITAAVVLAGLGLAGCNSQIPVASTYPMKTQRTMQAAQHWGVLADDVAAQVAKALDDRVELRLLAIDVKPETEGPFAEVFRELLRSRLVYEGLQVADRDEGQLVLRYKVQVVKHGSRFQRTPPGLLTLLGAGVAVSRDLGADAIYAAGAGGLLADVAVGHLAPHSAHEVVVTSGLVWHNRFVTHSSDIYYINDADSGHYGTALAPVADEDMKPYASRPMGVTNN
ncbi:outer membrane murein-binding lipoprotein Lpp [Desulfobaculum xiamenense]|uniref:Outer membrane murein-binding lipoprotein Lpp n=1 Tax=Desulfobaculum xiamenense TaxID=995050 RepID=A0A846QMS6_9BACT|nr:hypothetical protein [Desulfobaculum xiamenense]NJB66544.1 outer membrane murein-binding lipoprotein Lpp [Desulfobaculum xiamenense]